MPNPGKMDQLRNGNGHEIELAITLFTLPLHRGVTATNICTVPPSIGHGMQNGLVIMNCKNDCYIMKDQLIFYLTVRCMTLRKIIHVSTKSANCWYLHGILNLPDKP